MYEFRSLKRVIHILKLFWGSFHQKNQHKILKNGIVLFQANFQGQGRIIPTH
jgi:hypothetical protein